jgi:hypothetical protein
MLEQRHQARDFVGQALPVFCGKSVKGQILNASRRGMFDKPLQDGSASLVPGDTRQPAEPANCPSAGSADTRLPTTGLQPGISATEGRDARRDHVHAAVERSKQQEAVLNATWDANWSPMAWLPRLKIFRSPAPEFNYSEKIRGTFLHACLENLYLPDSVLTEAELLNIIKTTVNYTLRGFPLPPDALATASQDALDALSWFCSLPRAGSWLRNGSREQSVLDETGAVHRMDLLVQESGHCYVLEYKSGQAREEYREQLNRYLRLLAQSRLVSSQDPQGKPAGLSGILIYLDARLMEEINYA